MSLLGKRYCEALVDGRVVPVVDPAHFRSAPVPGMGLGLFCDVDLKPGDIWWANNLTDPRFVQRVIPWEEYKTMKPDEKREAEILCYIDTDIRALIRCTEPFSRVNHATDTANSTNDELWNSVISRSVKAGEQILISYDYDAVVSLVWKFPEFVATVPTKALEDETFLLAPVDTNEAALKFLSRL